MARRHDATERLRMGGLIEGTRYGSISPLTGEMPTWRMDEESTPIYDQMIADGYPSPWLDDDAPAAPREIVRAEVVQ